MQAFAELCEQISKTSKKTEKVSLVAAYFRAQTELSEAATAAIFLSGRAFPAYEQAVLNVGGALLSRALTEVAGVSEPQLWMAYRKHGDLGSAAFDVLELRSRRRAKASAAMVPLTLAEVESAFNRIAGASGPQKKSAIVRELLGRASPLEAKYLIKIITGELRIGLR